MDNGKDDGALAGWVILLAQGHTFLGKRHEDGWHLSPAYALHCAMQFVQPDPRKPPQLATMRMVQPILTFPSIRKIEVPAHSIVIPIETLSTKERRDLASRVEACEQMMAAMRAEDAGLTLVGPNVKMPEILKGGR